LDVIQNIKSSKKHFSPDAVVLVLTPILAAVLTLLLPINLLLSTLLFFGPAVLYLSLRRKDIVLRSSIFALIVTVISILTDYLAERDQSWASTSSFNVRIAGQVPIEALVWVFLFTYLIIAYFLFFFDQSKHKTVGKRMPIGFIAAAAVLVWLGLTAIIDVHFKIDWFYIKFGLLIIFLPLVIFTIEFPQYLRVFIKIVPYFIFIGLLNIIIGLEAGHWHYPGHHYVGWVQLGSYRFPLEELVFWIILYAPFIVSQYEFFNNDRLKFQKK
jgi:hypothetical protein